MLIQLNIVVIFVMACYFNSVIHKMILWQLDNLLGSACKGANKLELVTLSRVHQHITNTILFYKCKLLALIVTASEIDYPDKKEIYSLQGKVVRCVITGSCLWGSDSFGFVFNTNPHMGNL